VRDRFRHTLDGSTGAEIDAGLAELRSAALAGDLPAAAEAAADLGEIVRGL
jgi:hypothetical protein